ncbi:MAG: hypothetical protein WCI74_04675 [Actinomycetes bacterium]
MTLGLARRAGVRAVIFAWRGVSADNARGQYLPFTLGYQGIPAVFVAGEAAAQVLDGASRRDSAKLILNASVNPGSTTRTVWTVVEGTKRPNQSVLVISHSDGPNNVEENGHLGLVALARDLVEHPPERTVVLVFTTGHLRIPALTKHGQATTRWLEDHPDQWAGGPGQRRAVAGLAIEHLGAVEYADDPVAGTYAPTGRAEPELLYATTKELMMIARSEWAGAEPGPTRVSRPSALIHFGEGEPVYLKKVPGISLVTTPQYLLADNQSDFVDADLLARQVDSFARILRRIDTSLGVDLGRVQLPTRQAKAKAAAKIVASLLPNGPR